MPQLTFQTFNLHLESKCYSGQGIILTVKLAKIYSKSAFIKWITIKHTPFSFTFSENSVGLFKYASLLFELENAEGGRVPLFLDFYTAQISNLKAALFFLLYRMMFRLFESNGACGGRYPLQRDNQHNSLKLLESSAGFYTANDQFIDLFMAFIFPGAVILWGRPYCILKETFLLYLLNFELLEILLLSKSLTRCFSDTPHWAYLFVSSVAQNSYDNGMSVFQILKGCLSNQVYWFFFFISLSAMQLHFLSWD